MPSIHAARCVPALLIATAAGCAAKTPPAEPPLGRAFDASSAGVVAAVHVDPSPSAPMPSFCQPIAAPSPVPRAPGFGPRTGYPGVGADPRGVACTLPEHPTKAHFEALRDAPTASTVDLHALMQSGRACAVVSDFSALSSLANLEVLRSVPAECMPRLLATARLDHVESLDVYCGDGTSVDLHAIAKLQSLKDLTLGLGCGRGSDGLRPLGSLPSLEKLSDSSDLTGLGALKHLRTLSAESGDLRALGGVPGLEVLYLESFATDYDALRSLPNLRELTIRSAMPKFDPSVLTGMSRLEWLDLAVDGLTDLSALAGLTSLRSLELDVRLVTSLLPLASLQGLERLALFGGCREASFDLSPLVKLTRLEQLTLPRRLDPRTSSQRKALEAARPTLEIDEEIGPRHCGRR